VKEDIGVDVKENYVLYHLKDNDSEIWVIHDFNRVSYMCIASCELTTGYVPLLHNLHFIFKTFRYRIWNSPLLSYTMLTDASMPLSSSIC